MQIGIFPTNMEQQQQQEQQEQQEQQLRKTSFLLALAILRAHVSWGRSIKLYPTM